MSNDWHLTQGTGTMSDWRDNLPEGQDDEVSEFFFLDPKTGKRTPVVPGPPDAAGERKHTTLVGLVVPALPEKPESLGRQPGQVVAFFTEDGPRYHEQQQPPVEPPL